MKSWLPTRPLRALFLGAALTVLPAGWILANSSKTTAPKAKTQQNKTQQKAVALSAADLKAIQLHGSPEVAWCATAKEQASGRTGTRSTRAVAASGCPIEGDCDNPANRDAAIPNANTPIKIVRVKFNVIANDDGSNPAGTASEATFQIERLNKDFAPWRIHFVQSDYEVIKSTSFRTLSSQVEVINMKQAHVDSPTTQMNFYVADVTPMDIKGTASMPWAGGTGTYGGLVCDDEYFGFYSIATHEIGHVFGLWHTFKGVNDNDDGVIEPCDWACREKAGRSVAEGDTTGDFCSDTQPTPRWVGCSDPTSVTTDSCSGKPWAPTPYQNYMGYGVGNCVESNFTPQQAGRMHCWINAKLMGWVTTDTTKPTVTVTEPPHQSYRKTLTAISGTVNDDLTGIKDKTIAFTLYQNGDFWTGSSWKSNTTAQDPAVLLKATVYNGTWSHFNVPKTSNLRPGTYHVSAYAYDGVGNKSDSLPGINQTEFTIDSNPPTVAITNPATGSSISGLTQIRGNADDDKAIDRVAVYLIRLNGAGNEDNEYWDGNAWAGGGSAILPTSYNATNKTWQTTGPLPSSFTSGAYTVIAIAYDRAGNSTQTQADFGLQNVYTWTGATLRDNISTNDSTSWGTPGNWSPNGVPGAGDKAIVNTTDTITTAVNRQIGTLTFNAGHINFSGNALTVDNSVSWTGGAFSGTFQVPAGATMTLNGATRKELGEGSVINNLGTVRWEGGGRIYCYGYSGDADIYNEGVFDIAGDGQVFDWTYGGSTFHNRGVGKIVKSAGSGVASFAPFTLSSFGVVNVNAGTLEFSNTSNFQGNPQFAGAGKVKFNGDITLRSPVTSSSNVILAGGTLTGAVQTGVTVSSYGGNGIFDWTGGDLAGVHTFNAGAALKISGDERKDLAEGTVINNAGTMQWQGGGPIYCYGYNADATINNTNIFDVAADGQVFQYTHSGSVFNNKASGKFIKSAGIGIAQINRFVLINEGELRATAGQLDYNQELRLLNGGKMTGAGSHLQTAGKTIITGTTTIDRTSFTVSEGTLEDTGTIKTLNGGALNWTGGDITGNLSIAPSSIFNISGAARKDFGEGAVINNFGTTTWSEGDIYCYGYNADASFNNKSNALFKATSNGAFIFTYGGSAFNNEGNANFQKTGAGTTTRLDWDLNNAGTARTLSGTTTFNNGGTSGGTFTADSPAIIKFTGGYKTFSAGVNFNGAGKVQIDGANVTANGNLTSGTTGNLATLEILSGVLGGTPIFTGTGTVTWKGGVIAGTFTLDTGAKMLFTGPDRKEMGEGATINNKGTMTWDGGGAIYCYGYNGDATINNLSGGVFNLAADGVPFALTYSGSAFVNHADATFAKTAGTGTTTLQDFVFNSSGTILTQTGILESAGTLNIQADPKIAGAGKLRLIGTTTLSSALTSSSNMRLEGGGLTGVVLQDGSAPASYGGSGIFDWSGGSTIGGTLKLLPGATMKISGEARKDMAEGAVLNNAGNIEWQGSGSIYCYGYNADAVINNLGTGKFEITADGQIFSSTYGGSVFNNEDGAAFLKTAGEGTTEVGPWLFNNHDTIVCSTGLLNFSNDLNLKDGGWMSGVGRTRVTGGTTTLTGTTIVTGTVFEFANGTLLGSGTDATLSGGRIDWTGGTLTGMVNFAANSNVEISGDARKAFAENSVLNNAGTITWRGGDLYCYGYSADAVINNLAGATFNTLGGGLVHSTYDGSVFNNHGLVVLPSTGGAVTMNWAFKQSATGKLRSILTNATTYGQMTTGGSVALAGALEVQAPAAYAPANGAVLKIINASNAATGTFTGLAEDAILKVNGYLFQISYAGGDGNDVTLTNVPALITVADVRVVEGNIGTVNAVFTVRLSVPTPKTVTVKYATANGNANGALAGTDYTALPLTTLTFAPNETSKTVTVTINSDLLDEFDETYFLNLSAPTNAALGDAQAIGTIADNDALPSVSINDISIVEGSPAQGAPVTKNAVFTVTLSAPSGRTTGITCATGDGTARTPADYTASRINLSFAPGETSKTFSVPLKTDTIDEADELFYGLLSLPVNVGIARARGVATITDDDAAPAISINNVTIGEGHSGTRSAVFSLTLSAPSGKAVKVNFATATGANFPATGAAAGTAGADFVAVSTPTTIAFNAGATVALARVTINGDLLDEENETFRVLLSTPVNATIADGEGIGTITDDDAAPALSINDASIAEGNSGSKNLTFTVTLSKTSAKAVTVNYATGDGTAKAGIAPAGDYTSKSGTLSFAANSTGTALSKTIVVPITGDVVVEANELFYVFLSGQVNATVSKARGVATISNDDVSG
jgi:hypothetical protein